MKNILVFIFIALIALIKTQEAIKINIHSVSNCDEGNPKVTLAAFSEGIPSAQPTIFNMTLVEDEKKEYITN